MLQGEKLFPLPVAYEKATGVRPHISSCHRHRLKGCHGILLETMRCAGRRMTSIEAVHRFNEGVTRAVDGERPTSQARTPRQSQAAVERAKKELARDGI